MSKKSSFAMTPAYPALGTLIDNNTLELVEVLGTGGYGIVYRAVEVFSNSQRSYAVKCLTNTHAHSTLRRQLHIREITLHQIASAHPSVVSLVRVVEDVDNMFIIMEYATDHDLFTQILHKCRYLGDDALIKHIFLQMIDAVQYCHSLGIYHRDLKPENILCFDGGYRVAITDFGLATTDKSSREFRTGSIYHMSPECQAGDSEDAPPYSPMHNDIWSLGIILLNLVTGRNPWKCAMSDDPTYDAYRQDPLQFLPSVLPISDELNNILVQTLDIDWRGRLSLSELRDAVTNLRTFYCDNVVFEGSLARCPWEAGMDLGNGPPKQHTSPEKRPVPHIPDGVEPYSVVSTSAVTPCYQSQASTREEFFETVPWDEDDDQYLQQNGTATYEFDLPYERSGRSSYSSDVSEPATPSSVGETPYHRVRDAVDLESVYKLDQESYYDARSTIYPSFVGSTTEDTDDERFASSVFLATPVDAKPFYYEPETGFAEDYRMQKKYTSPKSSLYGVAEVLRSKFSDDSDSAENLDDFPPTSPNYGGWSATGQQRGGSRPIDIQQPRDTARQTAARSHNIFNPRRFFPRSSGSSWLNPKSSNLASRHMPPTSGDRTRPFSPSPGSNTRWSGQYHTRTAPQGRRDSRHPAGAFSYHTRFDREWIP